MDGLASGYKCPACGQDILAKILFLSRDGKETKLQCSQCATVWTDLPFSDADLQDLQNLDSMLEVFNE